jgi:hypothetical protein
MLARLAAGQEMADLRPHDPGRRTFLSGFRGSGSSAAGVSCQFEQLGDVLFFSARPRVAASAPAGVVTGAVCGEPGDQEVQVSRQIGHRLA